MKINTSERQGKCECDLRIKRKKQKSRFKEPFFLHVMSRKLRNISIPKDFPLGIPTTTACKSNFHNKELIGLVHEYVQGWRERERERERERDWCEKGVS
jgi:hypothetical protein